MNPTNTPRVLALIASIATTFLIVHALAAYAYGYPLHDVAAVRVVAHAASSGSR